MSMASFNMFVGGAVGTFVNGMVMKSYGTAKDILQYFLCDFRSWDFGIDIYCTI